MKKISLHNYLTEGETYDIKIYQNDEEQETLRYLSISKAHQLIEILNKYKKPGIKLILKKFKDNKFVDSKVYK